MQHALSISLLWCAIDKRSRPRYFIVIMPRNRCQTGTYTLVFIYFQFSINFFWISLPFFVSHLLPTFFQYT